MSRNLPQKIFADFKTCLLCFTLEVNLIKIVCFMLTKMYSKDTNTVNKLLKFKITVSSHKNFLF